MLSFDKWRDRRSWNSEYIAANDAVMAYLASQGDIETLQKFHEKYGFVLRAIVFTSAAQARQFETFEWLYKNKCPQDSSTIAAIAEYGEFKHVIQARMNGCPWDFRVFEERVKRTSTGDDLLSELKWLFGNGCPWNNYVPVFLCIRDDRLPFLKWTIEHGCSFDKNVCLQIAEKNHAKSIVEYLTSL